MEIPIKRNHKESLIIPAQSGDNEFTGAVIWFHGLGDSGHGWYDLFLESLRVSHLKVILPSADPIPYTAHEGRIVPAWFNRIELGWNAAEDRKSFEDAVNRAHSLIREQIASGIPSRKIIIGGFSMGGGLALYAGLTFEEKLGGICCASSYIMARDDLHLKISSNQSTSVLILHGKDDDLVPEIYGKNTETFLRENFGINIDYRSYPEIRHALSFEGCHDLKEWFLKVVPPPPSSMKKRKHRKNKTSTRQ